MNQSLQSTYNYLVPADGTTHEVSYTGTLVSGQPYTIDWFSFVQNNFPFRPQGAKMQNTSSSPVVITNPATGETSTCPPNSSRWVAFTSTAHMQQQISGSGKVSIIFVDYPVIETAPVASDGTPVGSSGGETVSVSNFPTTQEVSGSVSVSNFPATQQVSGSVSVSNFPATQEVQIKPGSANYMTGTVSSDTATEIGTPPPNSTLRALIVTLPGTATQTTGGEITATFALNGVTIATMPFYVSASATVFQQQIQSRNFGDIAFNAGASGTLTCTLSAALATGKLYVDAYFD